MSSSDVLSKASEKLSSDRSALAKRIRSIDFPSAAGGPRQKKPAMAPGLQRNDRPSTMTGSSSSKPSSLASTLKSYSGGVISSTAISFSSLRCSSFFSRFLFLPQSCLAPSFQL
jgi:hypothetical protein